jgi:hypothetical protein
MWCYLLMKIHYNTAFHNLTSGKKRLRMKEMTFVIHVGDSVGKCILLHGFLSVCNLLVCPQDVFRIITTHTYIGTYMHMYTCTCTRVHVHMYIQADSQIDTLTSGTYSWDHSQSDMPYKHSTHAQGLQICYHRNVKIISEHIFYKVLVAEFTVNVKNDCQPQYRWWHVCAHLWVHILVIAYNGQWISQQHWPPMSKSRLHFICGTALRAWYTIKSWSWDPLIHDILNSATCVRNSHREWATCLLSLSPSLGHMHVRMHTYTYVLTTISS